MEASVAAQGQSGDAAQVAGQAAEGQQGAGPDLGAVIQQLQAVTGGQEQLRELLLAQQPNGEEPAEDDPLDLSWLDVDAPTFDPDQVAQRLGGFVEQQTEQSRSLQQLLQDTTKRLDTVEAERAEDKRREAAFALIDEFPELGETETAQKVVATARQYAEQNFPPEVASVLGNAPAFWKAIYMAGRAADAANAETGQDPSAATLEGGQGVRPGTVDVDALGDSIVSGRRGRGALPFG